LIKYKLAPASHKFCKLFERELALLDETQRCSYLSRTDEILDGWIKCFSASEGLASS